MSKSVKRLNDIERIIESYASDVISAHQQYEKELNKFHQKMIVFRDKVSSLRRGIGLMARKPDSPEKPKEQEYVPSPVRPTRNAGLEHVRVYDIPTDERRRSSGLTFDDGPSPAKISGILNEFC